MTTGKIYSLYITTNSILPLPLFFTILLTELPAAGPDRVDEIHRQVYLGGMKNGAFFEIPIQWAICLLYEEDIQPPTPEWILARFFLVFFVYLWLMHRCT